MGDVTVRPSNLILAVITTDPGHPSAGTPVFVARDLEELDRMALHLCRIAQASAHEIRPGTLIIMRH